MKKNKSLKLEEMSLMRKLVKLFLSTLTISAVAFGGGFVVLPMLKKTYVEKFKWISSEEYPDIIAIAQSSPGTIAGNTAMVIGYKIAGVLGAIATMLGNIIPPLFIITAVYYLYAAVVANAVIGYFMAGMQAGIAAVIFDFVVKMLSELYLGKNVIFSLAVMLGSFIISFFLEFSVIYIILIAIALGIGFMYLKIFRDKKREAKNELLP